MPDIDDTTAPFHEKKPIQDKQLWTYLQVMETRVKRLEEFIMKGYDWDRMLEQSSLQETIKDDVELGFYVHTTSELKRNI
jgi:hypothetical protein